MSVQTTVHLLLPYPPSVNHYWRMTQGRIVVSRDGQLYRNEVVFLAFTWRLDGSLPKEPLKGPLSVRLDVYLPDRRRRDVDNTLKAMLDALAFACIYEDDSQIKHLDVWLHEVGSHGESSRGSVNVQITPLLQEQVEE